MYRLTGFHILRKYQIKNSERSWFPGLWKATEAPDHQSLFQVIINDYFI